jgi:hypothetical protein
MASPLIQRVNEHLDRVRCHGLAQLRSLEERVEERGLALAALARVETGCVAQHGVGRDDAWAGLAAVAGPSGIVSSAAVAAGCGAALACPGWVGAMCCGRIELDVAGLGRRLRWDPWTSVWGLGTRG